MNNDKTHNYKDSWSVVEDAIRALEEELSETAFPYNGWTLRGIHNNRPVDESIQTIKHALKIAQILQIGEISPSVELQGVRVRGVQDTTGYANTAEIFKAMAQQLIKEI